VDIGPTLAAARSKAGLTPEDVSARTRIRSKLIKDIERDDYSACGGDFYARGHIRAIAKVVGTDPAPLIAEYDTQVAQMAGTDLLGELGTAAHAPGSEPTTRPLAGWHGPGPGGGPAVRPGVSQGTDSAVTQPVTSQSRWQARDPGDDGYQLSLAQARRVGRDAYLRSAGHARQAGTQARRVGAQARRAGSEAGRAGADAWRHLVSGTMRAGRDYRHTFSRARRAAGEAYQRTSRMPATGRPGVLLGAAAVAIAGLVAVLYVIIAGPTAPGHGNSTGQHRPVGTGHSARPSPTAVSRSQSTAQPAVALRPVRAVAFGPGGTGTGDNPQDAAFTLAGSAGRGWHTNWYTTANFGNLKAGTGLLLDMGQVVMVTMAKISLGSAAGGTLQLRAGDAPLLSSLRPVAQSADSGGQLTLRPGHPARARYLLIWFTRLPPDRFGSYQATIYRVSVSGYSS
jgi:Helix-turn-helix domain